MSLKATQKCVATSLSLSLLAHTLTQPHTCDLPAPQGHRSSVFAPLPSPKNESLCIWPRELSQLYNLDITCPLYSPLYIQGTILFREKLFYPLYITCPLLEMNNSSYQGFVGPFSGSKALVEAAGHGSWLWKLPLFHDAALWYRRGLNINIPATRIAPHRWWQHSTSALTEEETQMIQTMMMTWVATVGNNFCRRSSRTKKKIGASGDLDLLAPVRFVHPQKIHWILSHDIIPPSTKLKKQRLHPRKQTCPL